MEHQKKMLELKPEDGRISEKQSHECEMQWRGPKRALDLWSSTALVALPGAVCAWYGEGRGRLPHRETGLQRGRRERAPLFQEI